MEMARRLWRSRVLGIVLCLGMAAGAVVLAVGNGRKASRAPAERSDAWEVTTDLPEEKRELPEKTAAVQVKPDAPSRSKSRAPRQMAAEREPDAPSRLPSEPAGAAPPAGSGGPAQREAPEAETPEQRNSAEAHPNGGVSFTRDSVGVELDPTGDKGRQDADDDRAGDSDEDRDRDDED
jgi:hypothetical protein